MMAINIHDVIKDAKYYYLFKRAMIIMNYMLDIKNKGI
jgi:hypothetical protein